MNKTILVIIVHFWAALATACSVHPTVLEEAPIHPADAGAPAGQAPLLRWQAVDDRAAAPPTVTEPQAHNHDHHGDHDDHAHHAVRGGAGTGTITAMDPEAERITLDHGEIPGLMPAMEMAFDIDAALLEGLRTGHEVRFSVREGERPGRFRITDIVPLDHRHGAGHGAGHGPDHGAGHGAGGS